MTTSGRQRRAVCYESTVVAVWFEYGVLSHCRDTPVTTSGGERGAVHYKSTVVAVWFEYGVLSHCRDNL